MKKSMVRRDFSGGWQPNANDWNGPKNALLRMDNLNLDENGALTLRRGCSTQAGQIAASTIPRLFSTRTKGTRRIYAQVGNSIYVSNDDGAIYSLVYNSSSPGLGDPFDWVSMGSMNDHAFFAQGSTKKKNDGTTNWDWGLPTGPTPSLAVAGGEFFNFCTFNGSTHGTPESPAWVGTEGTLTVATISGFDAEASGATQLQSDSTTFRGVITRTLAAATDTTDLSGTGVATDDDIVEWYVYVDEPLYFDSVTLQIDVNDGTFADMYSYTWTSNVPRYGRDDVFPPESPLPPRPRPPRAEYVTQSARTRTDDDTTVYPLAKSEVETAETTAIARPTRSATFTPAKQTWNYLSTMRKNFTRFGSIASKDWTTVKAYRVIFAGVTQTTCRFDALRIVQGVSGQGIVYRACYAREVTNGYLTVGPPGAASTAVDLDAESVTVTVDETAAGRTDVTHIYIYRMGGTLPGFYRVARITNTAGGGTNTATDAAPDRDVLITGLEMETDAEGPPDNIIAMTGPYYSRLMCLTYTAASSTDPAAVWVYPSMPDNPETFLHFDRLRIGGSSERPYWIQEAAGGIYVGTEKDIYRISGTGIRLPDDTIDFSITSMHTDHPPHGPGVGKDGDVIVYQAFDGWRVFNGITSESITGQTSLLYAGKSRHSVSFVNIRDQAAVAFRCAFYNGQLWCITPEDTSTTSSNVIYVYDLARRVWYRYVYNLGSGVGFTELITRPDGRMIAGTSNGHVLTMDSGALDVVAASNKIAVTLWTVRDDDALPNFNKNPTDLRVEWDTGLSGDPSATIDTYIDTTSVSGSGASIGHGWDTVSLFSATNANDSTSFQLRITTTTQAFTLYSWSIDYDALKQYDRIWDSGRIEIDDFIWLREIRIKMYSPDSFTMTVRLYFEDTAQTTKTFTVTADKTLIYEVTYGREFKGRVPRIVLDAGGVMFTPYWVELTYRRSGEATGKTVQRIAA